MRAATVALAAAVTVTVGFVQPVAAECLKVAADPTLQIDPAVQAALKTAGLTEVDFFRVMQIVSRYETDGCWSGAAGNFDNQWLSLGIMQWNLRKGSLQPIIARFMTKFSLVETFVRERDRLMPRYGARFFDPSCRAIPIEAKCRAFLQAHYVGSRNNLTTDFREELDRLFESAAMRQIQLDYFGRSLTTVLDDLRRVFQQLAPAAWQVAWAMDLKTQQGRFPTDASITRIRASLRGATPDTRQRKLASIVQWYDALCGEGDSDGVRNDCEYNVKTWNDQVKMNRLPQDREETVHFTHLVSRTANNQDGLYQADTFQRRATIVFGRGSVHGIRIDFEPQP